jgi:hypothetical protein
MRCGAEYCGGDMRAVRGTFIEACIDSCSGANGFLLSLTLGRPATSKPLNRAADSGNVIAAPSLRHVGALHKWSNDKSYTLFKSLQRCMQLRLIMVMISEASPVSLSKAVWPLVLLTALAKLFLTRTEAFATLRMLHLVVLPR